VIDAQEPEEAAGPDSRREPVPSSPGFVSLFLADQRRLYRYIVALLGTEQDAEDVLQETAAVLWKKFADFKPGTSFLAWGCKIAYLTVLEHRRRKGKRLALLDPDVLEHLAAMLPPGEGPQQLRLDALEHCLGKLNPIDRELVDRCYAPQVKIKAIAAELGRPETSV
jgi:RNA polymerase sigma-70 factor (ECF subfamily)